MGRGRQLRWRALSRRRGLDNAEPGNPEGLVVCRRNRRSRHARRDLFEQLQPFRPKAPTLLARADEVIE
jgi:hypothetical protein